MLFSHDEDFMPFLVSELAGLKKQLPPAAVAPPPRRGGLRLPGIPPLFWKEGSGATSHSGPLPIEEGFYPRVWVFIPPPSPREVAAQPPEGVREIRHSRQKALVKYLNYLAIL